MQMLTPSQLLRRKHIRRGTLSASSLLRHILLFSLFIRLSRGAVDWTGVLVSLRVFLLRIRHHAEWHEQHALNGEGCGSFCTTWIQLDDKQCMDLRRIYTLVVPSCTRRAVSLQMCRAHTYNLVVTDSRLGWLARFFPALNCMLIHVP